MLWPSRKVVFSGPRFSHISPILICEKPQPSQTDNTGVTWGCPSGRRVVMANGMPYMGTPFGDALPRLRACEACQHPHNHGSGNEVHEHENHRLPAC